MDKKFVQTPLKKMLNPLYQFESKEEEEKDFQAIRMYKMDKGSTVCKAENLVGTDIFVMEDKLRQEDVKYQSELSLSVSEASKKDQFSKPYRRDVEVIRVLKRMHTNRVSKEWKNKLHSSSVSTDNCKYMKSVENFEPKQHSTSEFIDWAYKDTLRKEKTTRNFIMGIAEKLSAYEEKISQTILPKVILTKQQLASSSTIKKMPSSSSLGHQSSKSLLKTPAALITGKSLAEKLDRLEKKLKKKDQLRSKIDSSMYVLSHKMKPRVVKGHGTGMASARLSIMSTATSKCDLSSHSHNDPSSHPLQQPESHSVQTHSPRPPSNRPDPAVPPSSRKHRKLSISKTGLQATENANDSSPCGANTGNSPSAAHSDHSHVSTKHSTDLLTQTSLSSVDSFHSLEKNKGGTRSHREAAGSTSLDDQFAERLMRENKDATVEVLRTVQYYSSPDKLCKTAAGDMVVVNGTLRDDPAKKFFHPIQKEKDKSKSKINRNNSNDHKKSSHSNGKSSKDAKKVTQTSTYVADIMAIGLSNKEVEEREKVLILQKRRLGIPKCGYIEGIRARNNESLNNAQKQSVAHRQNLNRRANEFNVVKAESTRKGIEAVTRKELGRVLMRENRLEDLTVEDTLWRSRVASGEEKSSILGEQSLLLDSMSHKVNDISQMSDFKHIQPSLSSVVSSVSDRPRTTMRKSSVSEQDKFQLLLKQKVLEKASDDIKNTVFGAHSQVSPFAHGEVSPRQGDITFCENQSRMEEVVESKEIGYLVDHKWLLSVIDLVKGLAAARKRMSSADKKKHPATPSAVFVFIACLLRLVLTGVTVNKTTLLMVIKRVFSAADHDDTIVNQVITMCRMYLQIQTVEYCDFLISIGVKPPRRLLLQIKNAKMKKRVFRKVKTVGMLAGLTRSTRKQTTLKKVQDDTDKSIASRGSGMCIDEESDIDTIYSESSIDSLESASVSRASSQDGDMDGIRAVAHSRNNSIFLGKVTEEAMLEDI